MNNSWGTVSPPVFKFLDPFQRIALILWYEKVRQRGVLILDDYRR